MNPNILTIALELASKLAIRVNPELLNQFLHYRHSVWKNAARKQAIDRGQTPPTLVSEGRIRQWVVLYNNEFNSRSPIDNVDPSRYPSLTA